MQRISFRIVKTIIAITVSCLVSLPCFSQSSSDEIILGLKHLKAKEYEAAISSFTKAIEKDSTNVEAYTHRGREYFFKSNYAAALLDFNSALKFNPEHYVSICYKGRLLSTQGQYEKAFIQYAKAIRLEPVSSYAYRLRGIDKFDTEDYEGAVLDLYMAIEISPQQPAYTFYYSGVAKIKTGKGEEALKDFITYGLLKGADTNIHELMGDEYVKVQNVKLAIISYNKAILLNPNDKNIYMKRGDAKKKQGDKKGAIEDYGSVIGSWNLSEFIKL